MILAALLLTLVGALVARLLARSERALEVARREQARLYGEAAQAEVLRQSDRVKSALLSSVSHDPRTPLASIKTSSSSLLDEQVDWDPVARRELLLALDEEADRLTRFVSRPLELSRLEGGALALRKDWHAIGEILAGVAERLDPTSARVTLEIPDNLPLACIDYVLVEHVIINLVENALKYSASDAPVLLSAAMRESMLVVEVADRGPGVPPAERERIFDKFYRAPEQSTVSSGTGIGLAIARGLAQAHAGDVYYTPRLGGGSLFIASVPIESDGAGNGRS